MQAAQRRPQEAGGRHADLGVAGNDGNVCHQRDLEATAECIATDLSHRDLRKADQVVVEAERLAVHREPSALAGPRSGRTSFTGRRVAGTPLAVPAVGVVHVGTGAEHSVCPTQQHHGEIVIIRDAIQTPGNGFAHGSRRRSCAAWDCSTLLWRSAFPGRPGKVRVRR